MMLRYIIIFGLISLAFAQSTNNSYKSTKKQSEVKYMKSASVVDLKKQQFQSTKERPELNPVLSALINEDIKKSIDAKRHAEYEWAPSSLLSQQTTQAPVQTTVKYIPKAHDESVDVDSEAGSSSEKKQTSRIEIKQGPNGMDYEYEYVYYYYDDDDEKNKKSLSTPNTADDKTITNSNVTSSDSSISSDSRSTGGKNRYDKTNTTTKSNSFERNELLSTRGKGRQSIPVVEETSEERLPVNTRFPPRSTITPNVQVLSNANETTKRTSIKRPSLDLVDSQSFNRGDKGQSKSRIMENEFNKINDIKSNENVAIVSIVDDAAPLSNGRNAEINDVTTIASEFEEPTTQIMDKVALDLYAHLVNENSYIDTSLPTISDDVNKSEYLTTTEEITTAETPISASDVAKVNLPQGAQPINISELFKAASTTSTSTSTSTTATTTTTTTTKTTGAPVVGRREPFGNSRNRPKTNRSKATIEPKQPEMGKEIASSESKVTKPKNRFSRPSFISRSRPTQSTSTPVVEDENVVNEKAKPETIAPASRGRTRNRFNLRTTPPSAFTAEEKNPDENSIDASSSSAHVSSTQRSLRTRPTFNLRGRLRATPSSTVAPSQIENNESTELPINNIHNNPSTESNLPSANLNPSSRFNLRRPNQLLSSRGRVTPFAKTSALPAEQSSEISNGTDVVSHAAVEQKVTNLSDESEQVAAEPTTTPQTGLNRLRNRPRIQIQPKAPNASKPPTAASYIANRKANPLISRRKSLGSSTTTEEPIMTETNETSNEDEKEFQNEQINDSEVEGNAKEEAVIAPTVETTSEQARGLGLLANRRRLAARRPGTKL